jgi:hypothetical protein
MTDIAKMSEYDIQQELRRRKEEALTMHPGRISALKLLENVTSENGTYRLKFYNMELYHIMMLMDQDEFSFGEEFFSTEIEELIETISALDYAAKFDCSLREYQFEVDKISFDVSKLDHYPKDIVDTLLRIAGRYGMSHLYLGNDIALYREQD